MTVAMAIDNALAHATAVVIVHPYQKKLCFYGIGASIRTHQESQCLPYAKYFFLTK